MLVYLFLLFTIVPLIELALLIWIGGETAWWVPIGFVVLTGIAGAALARWQGWRAISRIREELHSGRIPASAMMDGVLVLVAAILLITPGVLTDMAAFALLLSPVRAQVKRAVIASLQRRFEIKSARFTEVVSPADWRAPAARGRRDEIVEAKVIKTHVEDAR